MILRSLLFVLMLLFCIHSADAEWIKQDTHSLAWFHDVFFVNQSKGWIVGGGGVMLSTDDGGVTWKRKPNLTSDSLLQIYFTSETTGWLLCERDIYTRGAKASAYLRKTADGGRTWDKIEFAGSGRERVTRLLFDVDGTATAFGEGGIFYRLQNDGMTWKKETTTTRFLLLDGFFANENVGAIVGAGGTILYTDDAGGTWERASLLGDTDARLNAVFFTSPTSGIAVGTKGSIFRTSGSRRLWRQQSSGINVNLTDVYFTNHSNGWAVGEQGLVLRTRDGGTTWTNVESHVTHTLEKVVFAGNTGWAVGYGGTVIRYDPNNTNQDTGSKPSLQRAN
jgi:photosystem II stability/assembly factor-like uncharacterized protein